MTLCKFVCVCVNTKQSLPRLLNIPLLLITEDTLDDNATSAITTTDTPVYRKNVHSVFDRSTREDEPEGDFVLWSAHLHAHLPRQPSPCLPLAEGKTLFECLRFDT